MVFYLNTIYCVDRDGNIISKINHELRELAPRVLPLEMRYNKIAYITDGTQSILFNYETGENILE